MRLSFSFFLLFTLPGALPGNTQTNLLLNGGFEDVNTCVEYKAECGVEAWFYLKDVKAQMLGNETNTNLLGSNSFGIFYNYTGYTSFTPVIGTVLPCWLQPGRRYYFKGILSAKLNPTLELKPGICLGEHFYVPNRAFSKDMRPDSIMQVTRIPNTAFFSFEYSFIGTGKERYLTFGTYTHEDETVKKKQYGVQTISLVLDNFELISEDRNETYCAGYAINKQAIYNYDYRHKEMDYSLFGRGSLNIGLSTADSLFLTKEEIVPPPVKADTLKLGDVFFDFNKARLKPPALKMLDDFFRQPGKPVSLDSIYIEGHTDSIGSDTRNLALSLERCESIRQWLLQYAIISPEFIQVHPFGRSKPVATNKTPEGRAQNRRVELIIFRKAVNR